MSFTRVSVNAVRVGASQMTLKGVLQQVQCVATSSHRESTLLPTVKSNLMNSTNPSTFVNLYSTSTNLSMPRLSEEGDRELANPNRKDIEEQDMGTGQSVVNHSTSDPHAFHPDGSSSEQIVAGERSTIDPLMEKHKSENSWNRRDLADKGVSEVSSSQFQEGEMKSGLNSQIDSSRQDEQMSDRSQSGKLSKNEHGRQPSLQDIDEADSIGP